MRVFDSTSLIAKILKIKAWKELVDTNMHVYLLTIVYVVMVSQLFSYDMIQEMLVLVGILSSYICFGFLWNDYCDMPMDIKAGKKRVIHEMPRAVVLGLLALLFLTGFLLIAVFVRNIAFILIYFFAYSVGLSYAAPLVRSKEKGWLGAAVDALGEKGFPVLLIFTYFERFTVDAVLCVSLFTMFQFKVILDHQVFDYEADVASGTDTLVVTMGVEKAEAILRFLRPVFALMYLLFVAGIYVQMPSSLVIVLLILSGYPLLKILVDKGVVTRVNVRPDIGGWIERIPLYDGYITASLGPLLFLLALQATLTYYPYAFLLALALASQFYILKGHFVRVASSIVRPITSRFPRK